MGRSWLLSFKFFLVLLSVANLHPIILAARSAVVGCRARTSIKVSWTSSPDDSTFRIKVENACRLCDAHNVTLHLTMLAPGILEPVDEKVIVKNGKSIRPGEKVEFTFHVNYLANIGSADPSAEFINCTD